MNLKIIYHQYVAPKIIVFTANKASFLENNKEYEDPNNIFYTFGGVVTQFEDAIKFLLNDTGSKILTKPEISPKPTNKPFYLSELDEENLFEYNLNSKEFFMKIPSLILMILLFIIWIITLLFCIILIQKMIKLENY